MRLRGQQRYMGLLSLSLCLSLPLPLPSRPLDIRSGNRDWQKREKRDSLGKEAESGGGSDYIAQLGNINNSMYLSSCCKTPDTNSRFILLRRAFLSLLHTVSSLFHPLLWTSPVNSAPPFHYGILSNPQSRKVVPHSLALPALEPLVFTSLTPEAGRMARHPRTLQAILPRGEGSRLTKDDMKPGHG